MDAIKNTVSAAGGKFCKCIVNVISQSKLTKICQK